MSAILYGGLAALQLAGGYFAAQNVRDTAELNEDIANMNAEFAELDAYDAEIEGETQVAQYQSTVDQTLSAQKVAFAVADVDATYGSAAEVVKETKFIADLNKMEIEKQAQEKALGYQRQARDYRLGADLDRAAAEGRASSTEFGAVTSALGTLSKADFTGYGPKRGGTPAVSGTGASHIARNEITGHQTLTRDF